MVFAPQTKASSLGCHADPQPCPVQHADSFLALIPSRVLPVNLRLLGQMSDPNIGSEGRRFSGLQHRLQAWIHTDPAEIAGLGCWCCPNWESTGCKAPSADG